MFRKPKGIKKRLLSVIVTASIGICGSLAFVPKTMAIEETAVESDYCQMSLEVYPDSKSDEKIVMLDGMMPENAVAEVVDVSEDYSGLAAYDITIRSDGDEYQPDENRPVQVEIIDPVITDNVELWHIRDDGKREQVYDIIVTEGRIQFTATGFSVYEIVPGPEPIVYEAVGSLEELTGDRADAGFCLYYGANEENCNYFTNTLNTKNGVLVETTDSSDAAVWYFEKEGDSYKIYTYVDSVKKYIHTKSGNQIELSEASGDFIDISKIDGVPAFYLKQKDKGKWIQHSNGGGGIRYYTDNNNNVNSRIKINYADSMVMSDDPYSLDGQSYGLMNYTYGSIGNAFMSNTDNYTKLYLIVTHSMNSDSHSDIVYVSQNSDITMWTFENVSLDKYKISVIEDGTKKYLKANGTQFVFTENSDSADIFRVIPYTNDRIKIISSGKYVTFLPAEGFSLSDSGSFLNFVQKTDITGTDTITYSANRISVSDGENASDGKELIVYTRIWDDVNKRYDFYAIDHDGSLKACYACGDKLMWLGDVTNSLLWKLTVYTNSSGRENGYYELQNCYSGKYLAPQINGGQTLSDNKIGIQLPGRKYEVTQGEDGNNVYNYGEYYSSIIAWDNRYYDYASLEGVVTDSDARIGHINSVVYSKADSFYFATIDDLVGYESTNELHRVETIDNADYGITMRMIDFQELKVTTVNPATGKESTKEESEVTIDYFGGNKDRTTGEPGGRKGLLSTDLDAVTNAPRVAYSDNSEQIGKDFGEAFQNAAEVNHLFIDSIYKSSGYFEFDSCQNYATLLKSDGTIGTDFTVYRELGTSNKEIKNTLKHGQFFPYNTISPTLYSDKNKENLYNFSATTDTNPTNPQGQLSDDDPRKYEKLYSVGNSPDYYFGMEMDASFVQTPSGLDSWGHDIIFEFTGDDDFWFYVDGELVLDLGGLHSAQGGTVNFRTGQVNENGLQTTLYDVFRKNYKQRTNCTEEQALEYVNGIFETNEEGSHVFKDYTQHHMRIYYMERGAGASNLHMRFNLSAVRPGHVLLTKNLSGDEKDLADIDYSIVQYPFQIYYKIQENDDEVLLTKNDSLNIGAYYQNSTQTVKYVDSYTPPEGEKTYRSVFFLNPGRRIEINFPDNAMYYRIVECAVNTEIYDNITVDGAEVERIEVSGTIDRTCDIATEWAIVKQQPTIVFDNHVKEGNIRTLNITKKLYNENGKGADNELYYSNSDRNRVDKTTFSFRLYLSNGTDDLLKLADLCKYYIKDPQGYICKWDADTQSFVSTSTKSEDINTLTDEQKEIVTFRTSRNGAISNIPAGYTVMVPGLPAGTKFMVEERANEIPTGYDLTGFDCLSGTDDTGAIQPTYYLDNRYQLENDTEAHTISGKYTNSVGTVRAGYNPEMVVNNLRGWGLKANKLWSDEDFVISHGSIYTAVYINDTLLTDSVREIKSGSTSVSYFFDKLEDGKTISDYKIYEVIPITDEYGQVTGYNKLNALDSANITATLTNNLQQDKTYAVSYEQGEPEKTSDSVSDFNKRTDTITNTRKGGIRIDLYVWNNETNPDISDTPLSGGTFEIWQGKSRVGTYTSDAKGNVTVLYDFELNTPYTLKQTTAPQGYTGLEKDITFSIESISEDYCRIIQWNNDNDSDNDTDISDGKFWAEYKNNNSDSVFSAEISIYNKPYTLQALKVDSEKAEETLQGAKFELYRSITSALGEQIKDFHPIYSDLITDSEGRIPEIDNTLPSGTYYLTEVSPPEGYEGLSSDIIFTLSPLGILSGEGEGTLDIKEPTDGKKEYSYVISVPNVRGTKDYYFDIEKIIFVDKNIHDSDTEQKFVFMVERFGENTESFIENNVLERFYVTVSCDKSMEFHSDEDIIIDGEKYHYGLYHNDDKKDYPYSEFISDGSGGVKIKKTYLRDDTETPYKYPAALWSVRQTIHVTQKGIYRVSEVKEWSSTDYDFWNGSNVYKGYGEPVAQGTDDGCVMFSVSDVKADRYKELSFTDEANNVTYRPTASFTNSETEFAYLSSQAYAENTLRRS